MLLRRSAAPVTIVGEIGTRDKFHPARARRRGRHGAPDRSGRRGCGAGGWSSARSFPPCGARSASSIAPASFTPPAQALMRLAATSTTREAASVGWIRKRARRDRPGLRDRRSLVTPALAGGEDRWPPGKDASAPADAELLRRRGDACPRPPLSLVALAVGQAAAPRQGVGLVRLARLRDRGAVGGAEIDQLPLVAALHQLGMVAATRPCRRRRRCQGGCRGSRSRLDHRDPCPRRAAVCAACAVRGRPRCRPSP